MKLKTKLYWGFAVVAVMMVILFAIVVNIQSVLQSNMEKVVLHYEKSQQSQWIRFKVSEMQRKMALLPYLKDERQIMDQLVLLQKDRADATASLDELQEKTDRPEVKRIIGLLRDAMAVHARAERDMMQAYKNKQTTEFARLLQEEVSYVAENIYPDVQKINDLQEEAIQAAEKESERLRETALWTGIALTALTLVLGGAVTLWAARTISRRINHIVAVIMQMADKSYEDIPRIDPGAQDEIGQIAASFNGMADALEEHARRQRDYQQRLEQESWLKSTFAEITGRLQGVLDLARFAETFIGDAAKAVDASYAVMYTRQEEEKVTTFVKAAGYAHSGGGAGRDVFLAGEGLIGQCAADGNPIRLANVPEDYFAVQSGLGEALPRQLLIMPVSYQNEVIAVLEFAFLEQPQLLKVQLLVQLADQLGIMIYAVQSHMHNEKLLMESQLQQEELQAQAEELQGQAEELQLQQEELRTTNEQLEREYAESDRRTRELERIREELERASRYKSEFLANMSHELRTPLNSLLILAQLLLENKEGNLLPHQLEFARTIHQSGSDLLLLINDVLDLSKVESGKLTVYAEECLLEELVGLWERQFRPMAQQKGLDFHVNMAPDIPRTVRTDPQRLQQIMINLLANAFKFTEFGEVRLDIYAPDRKEWSAGSELADAPYVLAFAVSDTGIGIPEDKINLIFETFQQADGSTSRSYGGSGLGLSISRQLASLLGGTIALKSAVGAGSRFTLYLPVPEPAAVLPPSGEALRETAAARADEALAGPEEPEEDAGGITLAGKCVLIVDDDMRNVFALTTVLEGQGMKVLFAENGGEAVEMMRGGVQVDIVLMDIMMPKVDGYEAMRMIRSMPEWAGVPIIALTAKAMKSDREKCIEAGASDYISKPVKPAQLISLIRVWLYR
ncbi:response regulator [Paenibacillus hamazuiensis]|uniref:response regulator n=1 Tax=Paenibacillus hamazuiensis TaxID=2936508 RepID=UPI00200FEFF9|nr:response regulator [Paenibacillus hamazuiensis]